MSSSAKEFIVEVLAIIAIATCLIVIVVYTATTTHESHMRKLKIKDDTYRVCLQSDRSIADCKVLADQLDS